MIIEILCKLHTKLYKLPLQYLFSTNPKPSIYKKLHLLKENTQKSGIQYKG